MIPKNLPKSAVVIGAGPSGLFAARRLRQLGMKEITIFEKEDDIGGKCSTFSDPAHPGLITERGAVVIAPNYGEVIDALIEHGITTEKALGVRSDSVEIVSQIEGLTRFQRMQYIAQIGSEVLKFNRLVRKYRRACARLEPLPADLEISFAELAKREGMDHINLFLKPLVSGFGYGDMNDCPAYSVLEYMGTMTIPYLIAQHYGFESCELRSITGGFQHLMRKMGENFTLQTSANIFKVNRSGSGVTVDYLDKRGVKHSHHAEMLVLAISPKHWESVLGKESLTPVEKECVDQLTYYRYPVVICRLKGLPLNNIYKPEALDKKQFGHVALVSTLDKRENPPEGRLCSAYINYLPHHTHDQESKENTDRQEKILADLSALPGVTGVEIIEYKIWDDYFSTLPWKVRLDLEKQQGAPSTKTIYVGSYTLGSFEDVACVANRATLVINNHFQIPGSPLKSFQKDLSRFFRLRKLMRG